MTRVGAAIESVHGDGTLPVIPLKRLQVKNPGIQGEYQPGTASVQYIAINPAALRPHLTLAHEIGHFIDFNAIPGAEFGSFGKDLERWRELVRETDAVKALMSRFSTAKKQEVKFLNYALSYEELWARSYAQYIAIRSRDAEMMLQLDGFLAEIRTGIQYELQWELSDFEEVANEIDRVFSRFGWLNRG